jgi:hypothetical protein
MIGVPTGYAALKPLEHHTGVRWNGDLVGEWQTQVGQAVERIPTKVLVEVQDAMTYHKTGFGTFPDIVSQIAKVSVSRLNI